MAEHLTGWVAADALGKRLTQGVTLKDEDGQNFVVPELEWSGAAAGPLLARTLLVRRDGHEMAVEGSIARIIDDHHSVAGTVLAFRNVTPARRAAAVLTHEATHDPLTGLANSRALERRIGHALNPPRQRQQACAAVPGPGPLGGHCGAPAPRGQRAGATAARDQPVGVVTAGRGVSGIRLRRTAQLPHCAGADLLRDQ